MDYGILSMTTLCGYLERITYRHPTSPFIIARVRASDTHRLVTAVGVMPGVKPGDSLVLTGAWETHARFGQQFRAEAVSVTIPDPLEGVRKFFASGFVKGIGPGTAGKLLAHFDTALLAIFDEAPERLAEVPGISQAKAAGLATAWRENQGAHRAMLTLQAHGISPAMASRILKVFGADAEAVLAANPYRMAEEIHDMDFFLADALALKLGIDPLDLRRLQACLLYLLEKAASAGHTFVEEEALFARCIQILAVARMDVQTALTTLTEAGLAVADTLGETKAVYLKALYLAEAGTALRLKMLLSVPVPETDIRPETIAAEVVKKLAIHPSGMQLEVLSRILSHRVAIITGGPGTGKTTLIRSICAIFDTLGKKICLGAPTGRAARRLSEVTRRKAATIHKLLGSRPEDGGFERNRDNPLEEDVIIIDEASMVDVLLMHHLMEAIPMTAVLVLVGDSFQLPPVGPGNVLSDLIASGSIPSFELTEIFRQAQGSPIVMNAHKVRAGVMPELATGKESTEFYFVEKHDGAAAARAAVLQCTKVIPEQFHIDPKDIQVLTPMHRGPAGTIALNQLLQEALNPGAGGERFRVGDRVMHLKNNYPKDVFNGDIGTVTASGTDGEALRVEYDGREVSYEVGELEDLSLAYAISVHKSQGSEYPAVVIMLLPEHSVLLQRNLLYTAMTRGRHLVVLVGSREAVDAALQNNKPKQRLSGMAFRMGENSAS